MVEDILDAKFKEDVGLQYLELWAGYNNEKKRCYNNEKMWEPLANVKNVIKSFGKTFMYFENV